MDATSLSLLSQLSRSSEAEAWSRLVAMYQPLIRGWIGRHGVQDSDADDLVQEVLLAVSTDLGRFEHGGQPGAFRAWMRGILVNRLRNFWRSRDRRPLVAGSDVDAMLAQLDDPASEATRVWNRQHDEHVVRQLLALSEPNFTPNTWTAFTRVALNGERPDEVAAELGMSLNAVVIAKSRVLSRLRLEADGLVEASSGFLANR